MEPARGSEAALTQFAKKDRGAEESSQRKAFVFGDPARTLELGLHVENVHKLSLKDNHHWAEGWCWMKWGQPIQDIIDAKKIPLTEVVEFVNEVQNSGNSFSLDSAEPLVMTDDRKYQLVRFSVLLYVNDLNLRRYPFVEIALPFTFEGRQDGLSCYPGGPPCATLKPFPDNAKSVIGQYADINGFDVSAVSVKPFLRQYNTNFGFGSPSSFDAIDFKASRKIAVLAPPVR